MANDKINDLYCSRVIFNENFDPTKDIYVSFEAPSRVLITEDNQIILTEDNIPLLTETQLQTESTGFAVFASEANEFSPDIINGEPGVGLGLISTDGTQFQNISGHIASLAVDFDGSYSLQNLFKDASGGNSFKSPSSVTARVSGSNSQFMFLSSVESSVLSSFGSEVESIRFGFKNYFSNFTVDTKKDDVYTRIFEANHDYEIYNTFPKAVNMGLTFSGNIGFGVRDITYSGVLSS